MEKNMETTIGFRIHRGGTDKNMEADTGLYRHSTIVIQAQPPDFKGGVGFGVYRV